MKRCRRCDKALRLDEFYVDRRNSDGRFGTCKACVCARSLERKDANPELRRRDADKTRRYRSTAAGKASRKRARARESLDVRRRAVERATAWNRAHPEYRRRVVRRRRERLGKKGRARVSRAAVAARQAMWGGLCWICGDHADQMDHVKPVTAGGLDIAANLRPICGSCNRRKSGRWPFPTSPKEARHAHAAV